MIRYADTLKNVSADDLRGGFFEGWPDPPSPETHLRLLDNSDHVVLALDGSNVVGFVTAISDGVLCAHVPLLEVLPDCRGWGIGRQLMRRMLAKFDDLYMVDLICDPDAKPFYTPLGMSPATGMTVRRYENQSGRDRPGAIY